MTNHKQIVIKELNISCDMKIAPLIKILNKNGFKTIFSCCYLKNKGPYVMIKMPRSRKKVVEFIQLVRKFYHNFYCLEIYYNVFNHAIAIYMTQKFDQFKDEIKFNPYDMEQIPYDLS